MVYNTEVKEITYDDEYYLVKEEMTHYGDKKLILKNKSNGKIIEKIIKN